MPFRPGQAKGPYVGPAAGGGGGAPVDAQYVVLALNGTLTQERVLTAGAGITITDNGANSTVVVETTTVGPERTDGNVPTFHDDFQTTSKPFWNDTEAITSGDWQLDVSTDHALEGIAQNNSYDWVRRGIEGNYDYAMKLQRNSATSTGFRVRGYDTTGGTEYVFVWGWLGAGGGNNLVADCTGEASTTINNVTDDTIWVRIVWEAPGTADFYYKIDDGDPWILAVSHTGKNQGIDKILELNSADTARIYEIILYDNMYSHQVKSNAPKTTALTDGANISVPIDSGNFFHVTLGGNRQLDNPTGDYPMDGQMFLLRVEQDGTGSRTLSFDTKYRFSTDLPSPALSTGAGDIDYLLFVYHESDDRWDYVGEVFGF